MFNSRLLAQIYRFVKNWYLYIRLCILCRHLVKRRDHEALDWILAFLDKFEFEFPLHQPLVREALFAIDPWEIQKKYQPNFLTDIQSYLVGNVADSTQHEWQRWLSACHHMDYTIGLKPPKIQALRNALEKGKLTPLLPENYDYLLRLYQKQYADLLAQARLKNDPNVLFPLIPFAAQGAAGPVAQQAERFLQLYQPYLQQCLVVHQDQRSLQELVVFLVDHERQLPIDNAEVIDALFKVPSWQLSAAYQPYLFDWVEEYLFQNIPATQPAQWQLWLRSAQRFGQAIEIMNPDALLSIVDAYHTGKLAGWSQEDFKQLFGHFLAYAKDILKEVTKENEKALAPIFLAYGIIVQLVGLDHDARTILKSWSRQKTLRPRALSALSDDQAREAPVRGVGSPHAVVMTVYQGNTGAPVRLAYAGSTGDLTLNVKIFTGLFAQALLCNDEPTFVMSGGGSLVLGTSGQTSVSSDSSTARNIVIGPGGPGEPTPNLPSLDMDAGAALQRLLYYLFHELESETGLVQRTYSDVYDIHALETQVIEALQQADGGLRSIRHESGRSPAIPAIHVMPLFHRNPQGEVEPIEIEIPYGLLGHSEVLGLLHTARQGYMVQLMTAAEQRLARVETTLHQQNQRIQWWNALSQEEKQREYAKQPKVPIRWRWNFETGEIKSVTEDEDRWIYEEVSSHEFRDSLQAEAERLKVLCKRLAEMNQAGGKADVLTLKLLMDAMLRQAPLLIAHPPTFAQTYRDWVELRSALIWVMIEEWARKRGLPPETLAADHILFNAQQATSKNAIVLQPMVMIDLADFLISIDGQSGTMQVFTGSATPTLQEMLLADDAHHITDLPSLHRRFCELAAEIPWLDAEPETQGRIIQPLVSANPRIRTLVEVEKARGLLFQGKAAQAVEVLNSVAITDLTPVYFWSAVAQQYRALEDLYNLIPFLNANANKSYELLLLSIQNLQHYARSLEDSAAPQSPSILNVTRNPEPTSTTPVAEGARELLQKLRAEDAIFVQDFVKVDDVGLNTILTLLANQRFLSQEEYRQFVTARFAASAVEFLYVAEAMKQTAKKLPYQGLLTQDVQEIVQTIVNQLRNLLFVTFVRSLATERVESLLELFNRPRRPLRREWRRR